MWTRLRNSSSQLGQTSVEYLGMIVIVVAFIGVLFASAPDIGHQIACGIEGQVTKVSGGDGSASCADARGEPTSPCVISDSSGQLKASVTAFSIKGGGQVKIQKQTMSDGSVNITVEGGESLGIEGKVGASGDVDVGDYTIGAGAKAKGSVSGTGAAGATWKFKSEKEADDFVDIVRNKARDGAIDAAVPVLGSIGTHFFGEHRSIPSPDIIYAQGGIAASASANATAGPGSLDAKADLSAAAGVKYDTKTGDKTVYFNLGASGSLAAGAFIAGAGVQGDLTGQLAITIDKDGKATQVQVVGTEGLSTNANISLKSGETPDELLKKMSANASQQSGTRGEIRGTLDLKNDPAAAAAFQKFLDNPITGVSGLATTFHDRAVWDARTYDFDRTKVGGDAEAGLGLAFGGELSYEGVDSKLKEAVYWGPKTGGVVTPWASCK